MGMGNRSAANGSMIAGNCLYLKAASVTITSGTGILYYGYGQVKEAGGD